MLTGFLYARLKRGISRAGWRRSGSAAALWSLGTIGAAASFFEVSGLSDPASVLLAIICVLVGGALGLWTLRIPGRIRLSAGLVPVNIQPGDLLEFQGHLVVGVNELFDSQIGNRVSPESLHGQVIREVFNKDADAFASAVANDLARREIPGAEWCAGENLRYPFGTTAVVPNGPYKVFLVALAHTDTKEGSWKASADVHDLWNSMDGLWQAVRDWSNGGPIAIPLLGDGQSQVPVSKQHLLQIILESLEHAALPQQKIVSELTVFLRESNFLELAPKLR